MQVEAQLATREHYRKELLYVRCRTSRWVLTAWVMIARYIHLGTINGQIKDGVLTVSVAKTSRKAEKKQDKSGGSQRYLAWLKEQGMAICVTRRTLVKIEKDLEDLGILIREYDSRYKMPIIHLNLMAAALFLEEFHPPVQDLFNKTGKHFTWLKPHCDEILDRPFNRTMVDGEILSSFRPVPEDVAVFQSAYPTKKNKIEDLGKQLKASIRRWCIKGVRKIKDCAYELESFVWWDVDIGSPRDYAWLK